MDNELEKEFEEIDFETETFYGTDVQIWNNEDILCVRLDNISLSFPIDEWDQISSLISATIESKLAEDDETRKSAGDFLNKHKRAVANIKEGMCPGCGGPLGECDGKEEDSIKN